MRALLARNRRAVQKYYDRIISYDTFARKISRTNIKRRISSLMSKNLLFIEKYKIQA